MTLLEKTFDAFKRIIGNDSLREPVEVADKEVDEVRIQKLRRSNELTDNYLRRPTGNLIGDRVGNQEWRQWKQNPL